MHIGRIARIFISLVLGSCAITAFLFWMADPLRLMAPSDQKLMATFHNHRAAFETLSRTATEDARREGYFNESYLSEKLPKSRQQEYKHLMSQIYPCINVTIWQTATGPDDVVRFEGAWAGLSAIGSEWSKGIAYIPGDYKKEGPILPNLDKPGALPYGMYLRQIEPHWFIYYDYID